MKEYYAVIDTNVVVSAFLKKNSVPDTILELAFGGIIIPLVNDEVLSEYRSVLLRKKFGFNEQLVDDFIKQFKDIALYVVGEKLEIELPDSKDVVFYEIVMEKRKSTDAYLVTGNIKHFPQSMFVVTPREMLNLIVNDNYC